MGRRPRIAARCPLRIPPERRRRGAVRPPRPQPARRRPRHQRGGRHDPARRRRLGGPSARQRGAVYELHVGTYTPDGTLDSAIARLDHLVGLGIDFVELLPVNSFNGEYNWGYDGVAWFAVQHSYGGPAAYRRFVTACHERGLAVIQDVVYNHLGPSGNVLPRFGPYLRSDSRNTWGDTIDLSRPEVRRYILDNARMWMRRVRGRRPAPGCRARPGRHRRRRTCCRNWPRRPTPCRPNSDARSP